MSTPNDGGPAFPVTSSTGDPRDGVYCHNGMSLRDWFAGQAINGLLSYLNVNAPTDQLAETAYIVADAMLKARNQ